MPPKLDKDAEVVAKFKDLWQNVPRTINAYNIASAPFDLIDSLLRQHQPLPWVMDRDRLSRRTSSFRIFESLPIESAEKIFQLACGMSLQSPFLRDILPLGLLDCRREFLCIKYQPRVDSNAFVKLHSDAVGDPGRIVTTVICLHSSPMGGNIRFPRIAPQECVADAPLICPDGAGSSVLQRRGTVCVFWVRDSDGKVIDETEHDVTELPLQNPHPLYSNKCILVMFWRPLHGFASIVRQ